MLVTQLIEKIINKCGILLTVNPDDEIDDNNLAILHILFEDIICLPKIKNIFFY